MNRSSQKKLQLVLVGAGLMGTVHAKLIHSSPRANLAAVASPVNAVELANVYQTLSFDGLESFLATGERPDGIVLATPNALHLSHALACLQAGIPVLLEKPIAASVNEAQTIVHVAEKSKVPILIGHHRAHSATMQEAVRIIRSGGLGQLVAVSGSACFYKPAHYFEDGPWRKYAGGGPILINMIHEIHNLRMMCGEIVEVQAMTSHSARGFEVEDTVVMLLRFESGALGTFVLSDTVPSPYSWELTSGENKSYPRQKSQNCYTIGGTHGSLSIPTMTVHAYKDEESRSWWNPLLMHQAELIEVDPLQAQLNHFLDVIEGKANPLVSARDGWVNMLVLDAITQAAAQKRAVSVFLT